MARRRIRQTALAGRVLRSSSSKQRKLFAEVGLRSNESVRTRLSETPESWPFQGEITSLDFS